MRQAISGVILCLAYIMGLLSTAFPWGGYALLGLGIGAGLLLPVWWRKGAKSWVWVTAGIVGFLATIYFQAKVPKPSANDISNFVPPFDGRTQVQVVTVRGKVESTPRLTRSQKAQVWMEATQLNEVVGSSDRPINMGKEVAGKLYVTIPLLQATDLNPGDEVEVLGRLYKPEPPTNPGSFDFKAYLAKEGCFAGMQGRQLNLVSPETRPQWGWWEIRQRIIRAQTNWLGVPEGPLVSAMVMGSQTVNLYLSATIKDLFAKVGLSHALAASGFQVSLILGVVLQLTRRLPVRAKFSCGVLALLLFLGLTGPQLPILRAVVMGVAALFALVADRKVITSGSLLFSATLLLLVNPLWIWDLSFQLSFLATLGLLVTSPVIIKWLDWIPPLFASIIGIPVAASLWTLPLQLYTFNVVSPYSILVSIISTVLITIISIVGFVSAIAALVWPLAGSAIAWLLYYPTHWLILLVEYFGQLPGNSVAVGDISILQLLSLYGIIILVWLWRWSHKVWWLAGIMAIALVFVPAWQAQSTIFRISLLAQGSEPVMVIQDRGKVTLINSGDANTARYTVLPFLRQEGINKIDWAISTTSQPAKNNGWTAIIERLPIDTFYALPNPEPNSSNLPSIASSLQAQQGSYQTLTVNQTLQIGSTPFKLINAELPLVQFEIKGQNWLMMGNLQPDQAKDLTAKRKLPKTQVLWWSGQRLTPAFLRVLQPVVAIASSNSLDLETANLLYKSKAQVYSTSRDGAIQWTPQGGFETTLELTENQSSLL